MIVVRQSDEALRGPTHSGTPGAGSFRCRMLPDTIVGLVKIRMQLSTDTAVAEPTFDAL